jgi:ketosteroid isomerase-like protein
MKYMKVQYEAGNIANVLSAFADDAIVIVDEITYSGKKEIEPFFTTFYSISQTFPYTINEDNGSTVNYKQIHFLYIKTRLL